MQCYFEDSKLVWTDGECWDKIEENATEKVELYPNPARDRVVIEGMEAVEVKIYNTSGQMVKCVRGTNEIDVSELPEGMYFITVGDMTKKFVENR